MQYSENITRIISGVGGSGTWEVLRHTGWYTQRSVKGPVLLFFRIYINVIWFLVCIKYFIVKISNLVRVENSTNRVDLY